MKFPSPPGMCDSVQAFRESNQEFPQEYFVGPKGDSIGPTVSIGKKHPNRVLDLRETRSDAIKSTLCSGRNCLQGRVCTSGVPEMKIGGHCRVP